MQKSGTKANAETPRDRYVTHDEYKAVWEASGKQIRLMMDLTYRTLQRPESDIIKWTPANVTRDALGARVIKHRQNKTGGSRSASRRRSRRWSTWPSAPFRFCTNPIIHNREGEQYTYSGIHSMLKAQINRLNVKRKKDGLAPILTFGFRDLKGKGATDMWLAVVPIEQIQLLCGHKDKNTTEIYIKARGSETAQPNKIAMVCRYWI